uniref:Uncharacterized protein n=1 Tax=Anguilla anguilla TaxID=7936 RepID=A0A0E9XJV3_ANGAN
MNHKSQHYSG